MDPDVFWAWNQTKRDVIYFVYHTCLCFHGKIQKELNQLTVVIERFSTECRKTKSKPVTYQLDYLANLKP